MNKKANIFVNPYKLSNDIKEQVKNNLKERNIEVCQEFQEDADLNIVLGGDGTFIKAVHDMNFTSIPYLGINTGHLGFYNDVKPEDVKNALENYFNGDYFIHELKVIECKVVTDSGDYIYESVNEIVLKAKYTSIIKFDLFVDGVKLQSFGGDGIIFSTPSGSTAYALSAGGAILYQNIDAFQITPLAAIRSSLHRSLDKSLIVPHETKIKLVTHRNQEEGFSLGVDGILKEHENIRHIEIKLSENKINKIVFDQNWFWINIRDKFI